MTALAVFGFIIGVIFLLYTTLVWVFYALNTFGEYNIGGVPNTWLERCFIMVLGGVLFEMWSMLFTLSPFTIKLVPL